MQISFGLADGWALDARQEATSYSKELCCGRRNMIDGAQTWWGSAVSTPVRMLLSGTCPAAAEKTMTSESHTSEPAVSSAWRQGHSFLGQSSC